jgi:catechol 2,3-dioxygenase-like lactoylglutathione lyase family enzyme
MLAVKPPQVRTLDMKLEVIVIPVTDVDRSKEFYGGLGWRLDAGFGFDDGFRVIQFTPPGSGASVIFGTNLTAAAPGSVKGLYLVVSDIEVARKELLSRGVKVSEPFHGGGDAHFGADEPICSAISGSAARIPNAAVIYPWPRSAIRMATVGCSRKLPRGFPVGWRLIRPLPRRRNSRPRCGAPQTRMVSMRNEQASMM